MAGDVMSGPHPATITVALASAARLLDTADRLGILVEADEYTVISATLRADIRRAIDEARARARHWEPKR
jgi:hypothetical protein